MTWKQRYADRRKKPPFYKHNDPNYDPRDPRHGLSGYSSLKCRCSICTAAKAKRTREDRDKRVLKGLQPDDPRHGTNAGYQHYGCRCDKCIAGFKAYHKEYYKRNPNNLGQGRLFPINSIPKKPEETPMDLNGQLKFFAKRFDRYAVTQKSLRQVSGALPKGWSIASFGQPDDRHWILPVERDLPDDSRVPSYGTPNVIRLHNPATGNSALVFDHSHLFKSNPDYQQHWNDEYWNFGQHPEQVSSMLSHLDRLTRSGIDFPLHLNLTHNRGVNNNCARKYNYFTDTSAFANNLRPNEINVTPPRANKYGKDRTRPIKNVGDEAWRSLPGLAGDTINQTITHEVGHLHSYGPKDTSALNSVNLMSFSKNQKAYAKALRKKRNPPPQKYTDQAITAVSLYSAHNVDESYAEHFTDWMHPTRPITEFTHWVGTNLGWPKTTKIKKIDGSTSPNSRSYKKYWWESQ